MQPLVEKAADGARRPQRLDVAVQQFREEGTGIDALAAQFGISRRSVFRILARGRVPPA